MASTSNATLPAAGIQGSAPPQRSEPLVPSLSPELDDNDGHFSPLVRSSTEPASLLSASRAATAAVGAPPPLTRSDPYHLAPEDAFYTSASPPHQAGAAGNGPESDRRRAPSRQALAQTSNARGAAGRAGRVPSGLGTGSRSRSRRRRKRTWRKLLWVKQAYPDNYTDQATFLENLQRNPRLKPYDFWPLVADSTVIVQHVCSVIIFVVCFVGIFQERLSPDAVAGWGSFATCIGWVIWEVWATREQNEENARRAASSSSGGGSADGSGVPRRHREPSHAGGGGGGGGTSDPSPPPQQTQLLPPPGRQTSKAGKLSVQTGGSDALSSLLPSAASSTTSLPAMPINDATSHGPAGKRGRADAPPPTPGTPRYPPPPPLRALWAVKEGRTPHRIATVKSAVLIYFTVLGLSPILKSLTRSTSSDSIWTMSFCLLTMNIFFFDYSGVWVGAHKFPVASVSTNAGIMASTVLASRLPSTGQVFSLTLFSIEVFGVFPVFRCYARHRSWVYHVTLAVVLVLGAGAGVGIIMGGGDGASDGGTHTGWPWQRAVAGMVLSCLLSAFAMVGCSWWLIRLQKYKNEIYGPWDPARPTIISRRHWDDDY